MTPLTHFTQLRYDRTPKKGIHAVGRRKRPGFSVVKPWRPKGHKSRFSSHFPDKLVSEKIFTTFFKKTLDKNLERV
jgi:hypothetical protein